MFLDPREDVCQIEYGTVGGADRVRERLKGESAEIERQSLERSARYTAGLAGVGTGRGPESVGARPFGLCNLEDAVSGGG